MTFKPIPQDRETLYKQVWTRPVREVAKAYGLSDRGLPLACKRRAIPVPPRGYWAKKQAGQTVERPPLEPQRARPVIELPNGGPAHETAGAPAPIPHMVLNPVSPRNPPFAREARQTYTLRSMMRTRSRGLIRPFGAAIAFLFAASGLWTPFVVMCQTPDGHIAAESVFADCCAPAPGDAPRVPASAVAAGADCAPSCADTPLLTVQDAAAWVKRLALHATPVLAAASVAAIAVGSSPTALLSAGASPTIELISVSSTVLRL